MSSSTGEEAHKRSKPYRKPENGSQDVLIAPSSAASPAPLPSQPSEALSPPLPDYIRQGLRVLVVGINPGVHSAARGRHYAGPQNHFWRCIDAAGLLPPRSLARSDASDGGDMKHVEQNNRIEDHVLLKQESDGTRPRARGEPVHVTKETHPERARWTCEDDALCLSHGIGFINCVSRSTCGSSDLSRDEIARGCRRVKKLLVQYQPRIALFNGKGIFETFVGTKCRSLGLQRQKIGQTMLFVMPSTSPRCAKWPTYKDKMPFFEQLKQLLDDHSRDDSKRETPKQLNKA